MGQERATNLQSCENSLQYQTKFFRTTESEIDYNSTIESEIDYNKKSDYCKKKSQNFQYQSLKATKGKKHPQIQTHQNLGT